MTEKAVWLVLTFPLNFMVTEAVLRGKSKNNCTVARIFSIYFFAAKPQKKQGWRRFLQPGGGSSAAKLFVLEFSWFNTCNHRHNEKTSDIRLQ